MLIEEVLQQVHTYAPGVNVDEQENLFLFCEIENSNKGKLWGFNRFLKVEKVNEQEATLHELSEELYVESPVEEATSYWYQWHKI